MVVKYDAEPTLKKLHRSRAQCKCIMGPIGCYDRDTEYLSPDGWRKISEYDGGEVAQFDRNGGVSTFVYPEEYIVKSCDFFWYLRNDHGMNQMLSNEHKVLYFDNNDEEYHVTTAFQIGLYFHEYDITLPCSFSDSDNINQVTDLCISCKDAKGKVQYCEQVASADGKKYCFTVPSGFLVMRRNGCVFISGNSGKSVGCVIDVFTTSQRQKPSPPDANGIRWRKTRWAIIRNTFPELRSTTINTWKDWIPEDICPIVYSSPIEANMKAPLPDGTWIHMQVYFIALDKPKDVRKLLSLELTGVWINEARELSKKIVDAALSRTGRYPSKKDCSEITWTGLIMDTNPPDDDHWWHNLAENVKPKDWDFFTQPGALDPVYNEKGDIVEYVANPHAENVKHQQLGYRYWTRLLEGADPQWILVHVCGKYGSVFDGKPVYLGSYNDTFHASNTPLGLFRGRPIILGFDFGLTPACVICQLTPTGQLRFLRELVCERGGIKQFVTDHVKPMLTNTFPGIPIISVGDPAGGQASQADSDVTCFSQLEELGLSTVPAPTNLFLLRRQAVIDRLTRTVDGEPALLIDPSCKMLRKAFIGGYKFERIQVSGQDERFKDVPSKNKFSHVSDAAQYVCSHVDTIKKHTTAALPPPPPSNWEGMV